MGAYENYMKVKMDIEAKRLRALAVADERNAELRERSEIIRRIDAELEGTGLKLFRAACRGEDIEPIKERNQELMALRRGEIQKLGLPADYTDVHYSCKKCSDSGFINGVKICTCFKEALTIENIKSSGLGTLIEKQSFENFDLERFEKKPQVHELMSNNVAVAKKFVKNFPGPIQNLFLAGTTGTGKTHITTAIAREIIARGYDVVYETAQNIVNDFEDDRFRNGYSAATEPKSTKYMECDLLIIDDLGTEFKTQFSISCLYNLFNTRLNKGLHTIVSTNYEISSLGERYDARIVSRLIGSNSKALFFENCDDARITK